MPAENFLQPNESGTELRQAVMKRLTELVVGTAVWAALLFIAAGRTDWPRAWIYLGAVALTLAFNFVFLMKKNPALVAERGRKHKGTKRFDRVFSAVYGPLSFALPVVAGLDAARFGWTSLPFWTLYPGMLLYVIGYIPISWSMAVNPHLETGVRIQTDRDHRVVTSGPYRIVRHPMYVGIILENAGAPLALGSLWTFAVVGIIAILFVIRTALEDRTLINELPGYDEYARRTRYRLLPGVF